MLDYEFTFKSSKFRLAKDVTVEFSSSDSAHKSFMDELVKRLENTPADKFYETSTNEEIRCDSVTDDSDALYFSTWHHLMCGSGEVTEEEHEANSVRLATLATIVPKTPSELLDLFPYWTLPGGLSAGYVFSRVIANDYTFRPDNARINSWEDYISTWVNAVSNTHDMGLLEGGKYSNTPRLQIDFDDANVLVRYYRENKHLPTAGVYTVHIPSPDPILQDLRSRGLSARALDLLHDYTIYVNQIAFDYAGAINGNALYAWVALKGVFLAEENLDEAKRPYIKCTGCVTLLVGGDSVVHIDPIRISSTTPLGQIIASAAETVGMPIVTRYSLESVSNEEVAKMRDMIANMFDGARLATSLADLRERVNLAYMFAKDFIQAPERLELKRSEDFAISATMLEKTLDKFRNMFAGDADVIHYGYIDECKDCRGASDYLPVVLSAASAMGAEDLSIDAEHASVSAKRITQWLKDTSLLTRSTNGVSERALPYGTTEIIANVEGELDCPPLGTFQHIRIESPSGEFSLSSECDVPDVCATRGTIDFSGSRNFTGTLPAWTTANHCLQMVDVSHTSITGVQPITEVQRTKTMDFGKETINLTSTPIDGRLDRSLCSKRHLEWVTKTEHDPCGLQDWEIALIAVGCALFVLLVVGVFAFGFKIFKDNMNTKATKKQDPPSKSSRGRSTYELLTA